MRIVVVGGVATGMSAAARARRLDESAEIIVLERGPHVSFANCGLPYHVGGQIEQEASLLLQTPASLAANLALDVRVNSEVTAINRAERTVTVVTPTGVEQLGYDALVLAPGAKAVIPPLPGLDLPQVRTLRTVPDAVALREAVDGGARRAVVLGAGFIGLEAVEALRHRGLTVDLVELAPQVLPPLDGVLAGLVADELRRNGVTVRTGVAAAAIEANDDTSDGAVTVVLADGTRLPADAVVLSVGVRPDSSLAADAGLAVGPTGAIQVDETLRTSDEHIWAGGDAIEVVDLATGARGPIPMAGPANRQGRYIADAIMGRPVSNPATLGTAIVRVFDVTAATTGANARRLSGTPHHTLHLHPADHAGYYPGAQTMHLVVHIGEDGRLLGAQAVGGAGVDKRIDVLATAMRTGMAAPDLIDLDLAYSPPYGSAKDPVNMIGYVASNVVDGTLRLWYPEDYDAAATDVLVLDVRSAWEWSVGHLPTAMHVPIGELRDRINEVLAAAAGRPVRVHCASGFRSYLAHRVLVDAGLDSASLSGGLLTFRAARPDVELVTD